MKEDCAGKKAKEHQKEKAAEGTKFTDALANARVAWQGEDHQEGQQNEE